MHKPSAHQASEGGCARNHCHCPPNFLHVLLMWVYCTHHVVPGRFLMARADEEVKMLLEAFQMSVPNCLSHPTMPLLHSQMAGRLIGVQIAKQMKVRLRPGLACHV